MGRYHHVYSLVIKEFLIIFRDPKSRMLMIMPPLMQLFIFAFAATLEVRNVNAVILNLDQGEYSQQVIEKCRGTNIFKKLYFISNAEEIETLLDTQRALVGITFQQDFSKNIARQQQSDIQVILDGRRSNAAQIVAGYFNQIVNGLQIDWLQLKGKQPALKIIDRNWFNPNLVYLWSTVPSLVAILSMLISLIITSLSVARERELGTFEQILVSPLLPYEILIGKTIPAIIIGVCEGMAIWCIAVLIFKIPFTGSIVLLLTSLLFFICSIVGIGLTISGLVQTQQQAILGTFVFMVPAVTLSGYASPIENMPNWLQHLTWFNPLSHGLIMIKGLFLKDMKFYQLLPQLYPLITLSWIMLTLASYNFSKNLE